jgi:1-acyl-sn-glycerol-3-phosphate acyltransferase
MLYILNKKDVLAIFPEGKRSRTGFVDTEDFSYGVGQLLKECPQARVLCIYLRGKKAGGFADFPIQGEDFYFAMETLKPHSDFTGLKKVKEYSTQIIQKLYSMEEEFLKRESIHRK